MYTVNHPKLSLEKVLEWGEILAWSYPWISLAQDPGEPTKTTLGKSAAPAASWGSVLLHSQGPAVAFGPGGNDPKGKIRNSTLAV